MAKKSFQIFAVSDATGELAHSLAVAASRQFEGVDAKIVRRPHVRTPEKLDAVLKEAKSDHAIVLFTMVSDEARRLILSKAKELGVAAMDVMGPVLDMLSHYFHKLPSDEPGLQYKVTKDYFSRTEAIEFTVRHDDGTELSTMDKADIVLLGISRTSKTPLSIYLAYHGYRCANIPVVKDMPLPKEIEKIDRKKMVGLVVQPNELSAMRSTRLKNLGRPDTEHYAKPGHVELELHHAQALYKELGILVVDVTSKAIEEVATEIIDELKL